MVFTCLEFADSFGFTSAFFLFVWIARIFRRRCNDDYPDLGIFAGIYFLNRGNQCKFRNVEYPQECCNRQENNLGWQLCV